MVFQGFSCSTGGVLWAYNVSKTKPPTSDWSPVMTRMDGLCNFGTSGEKGSATLFWKLFFYAGKLSDVMYVPPWYYIHGGIDHLRLLWGSSIPVFDSVLHFYQGIWINHNLFDFNMHNISFKIKKRSWAISWFVIQLDSCPSSILFICHLALQDADFDLFRHKSRLLPFDSIGPKVRLPEINLLQLLIDPSWVIMID